MAIETYSADTGRDMRKLAEARRDGYKKLEPFRLIGAELIVQMCGPYYGMDEWNKAKNGLQPYNALWQAMRILVANLVPRMPTARANPKKTTLRPYAESLQIRLNQWSNESRFKDFVRSAVLEALVYPFAVARVGEKMSDRCVMIEDCEVNIGEKYAGLVTFDDYVMDPEARNDNEKYFEAVRYRVSKDYFAAMGVLDGQALKTFMALPTIDQDSEERSESEHLSGDDNRAESQRGMVELWDYFLYHGDRTEIVTMPPGVAATVLNRTDWKGPRHMHGPLHKMRFQDVINNPMPLPPLYNMRNLATAIDDLMVKRIRQLKHAKTVFGYQRGEGTDDMRAIQTAGDLDGIAMDDTGNVVAFPVNGIQPGTANDIAWLDDKWNTNTGMLHTLAGGSDRSKTATASTQDNQNAGVLIGDMMDSVTDFAARIYQSLAYYDITNPMVMGTVPMKLSGGTQIDVPFSNEDEIDPDQIGIDIDVVSMVRMDPRMRLRSIVEYLGACAPVLQLQQFGIPVNAEALGRMGARELDAPEITEIFGIDAAQMLSQAQMQPPQAGMPPGPGQPQLPPRPQGQPTNPAQIGAPRPTIARPIDATRSAMAGGVPR